MKQIPELKDGLNLPKHMAEHMYMFSGESIPVKLETTEDMIPSSPTQPDFILEDFNEIKKYL